ncbi:MAG: endopeptidase La [Nitrospinota bacterium]|nr:endopeptidase La [Nitrospinota bacterium]
MSEKVDEGSKGKAIPEITDDFIIPGELPLLPVRDIVVFPFMILPLYVGRAASIEAVNAALAADRMMLLLTQKDSQVEEPTEADLYNIGTVAMIIRMHKQPDGRVKILVQGLAKARLDKFSKTDPYVSAKFDRIPDPEDKGREKEEQHNELKDEAILRSVRGQLEKVINMGKAISPDILVISQHLDQPGKLADLVVSNLSLKVADSQSVLEIIDPRVRLEKVSELLNREVELLGMQQKIQDAAHEEMTKTQREYYLREQLKAIQKELGEIDEKTEEINDFLAKIRAAGMPKEVEKEAEKQLGRLAKMHTESAEATTVRTYLEWMVEVPWSKTTIDNLDLKLAQKTLDQDHYGLEKIKERIIEFLAVRKLKDHLKGPILCFVGPPGVGKTSLGQSVARALGRKFFRISLGGVRDEAEIRGHRRTYIGALPGRIIQGLKQAGTLNPVYMMDEIDKLGSDFRGDPSSALLEVLDPAQNNAFVDHYLAVPVDLTNVMFITTANMTDTIPSALLDRMEVISLSGYTEEEKVNIARRYLIPRQLSEHGLNKSHMQIPDETIRQIIRQYTREAGLRNLEREMGGLCRKVARSVASGKKRKHVINPKDLSKYLGVRVFSSETEQEKEMAGVATGVAWTMAGGEVMHVEASVVKGSGKLTLTGKLGEVMKESALAALTYIRSRAKEYGLSPDFAKDLDIHIHIPAGAIPKDGPSAGVTMATALVSALTGAPVRRDITMTGEITLRGRVLPIGGLKEKSLAASRAGIFEIIIPDRNVKDLEDIPENVRSKMKFHSAKTADQVLDRALTMTRAEIKKQMLEGGKVSTPKAGSPKAKSAKSRPATGKNGAKKKATATSAKAKSKGKKARYR